ncbi:unnamed protein product [Toxocara canis]|uniref:ZP domain-containing protein n=1 Tax=Toxocara canis TaxID=6265 RepID=A0A183UXW9_TOXCA|nr:unnamed protein product [Toxocara canis]
MPNGNHLNRPINLLYPLKVEEPSKRETNHQPIQLQDTTKRNDEVKCESSKLSYSSTINPIKYAFFILSILALLRISHGNQISKKCSRQTPSILLYSPSCLSSGLLVKGTIDGQIRFAKDWSAHCRFDSPQSCMLHIHSSPSLSILVPAVRKRIPRMHLNHKRTTDDRPPGTTKLLIT